MDASILQKNVQRELDYEPRVDSSKIGVSADDMGTVSLSGSVGTYSRKLEAQDAAKRVEGVRGLVNDIDVKVPSALARDDEDLAIKALNSISWRTSIPDDPVTITVSRGWVVLEGDVDFHFQKQSAEDIVSSLTGVTGVTNNINVQASALYGTK